MARQTRAHVRTHTRGHATLWETRSQGCRLRHKTDSSGNLGGTVSPCETFRRLGTGVVCVGRRKSQHSLNPGVAIKRDRDGDRVRGSWGSRGPLAARSRPLRGGAEGTRRVCGKKGTGTVVRGFGRFKRIPGSENLSFLNDRRRKTGRFIEGTTLVYTWVDSWSTTPSFSPFSYLCSYRVLAEMEFSDLPSRRIMYVYFG